jgi:hypothetical protein
MKYKLDNSSQQEVLDQITKLDDSLEDVNIQVKFNYFILLILTTNKLHVIDLY